MSKSNMRRLAALFAASALATVVSAAPCTPDDTTFSPTPTVIWDQVPDADLYGYNLYISDLAGTGQQLLAPILCKWNTDEDGVVTRFCRGADAALPLQRYCATCQPFQSYFFYVRAVDTAGNLSPAYSTPVEVCFSPLCVAPGPCT